MRLNKVDFSGVGQGMLHLPKCQSCNLFENEWKDGAKANPQKMDCYVQGLPRGDV